MKCNLVIRILANKEDSDDFLIYVDEFGNFPTIELKDNDDIDLVIHNNLSKYFYTCIDNIIISKTISSVKINKDTLSIFYNFFSYNTPSLKSGSFIDFNKQSINLYRFAKNKGNK